MASLSDNDIGKDYHALGLSADASPVEVKRAYRELVKRWHPDRFHQQSVLERRKADERIKEITSAYHRISKEWARQRKVDAQEPSTEEAAQAPPRESPAEEGPPRKPASARSWKSRIGSSAEAFHRRFRTQFRSPSMKRRLLAVGIFVTIFLVLFTTTSLMGRIPFRFTRDPGVTVPERSPRWHPRPPAEETREARPPAEVPEDARETAGVPRFPPDQPGGSIPSRQRPDSAFFTLGSTQSEVLRIQGRPSRVQGQIWVYGLSEIQFKEGRLVRYNNFDGSLKIRLQPQPDPENPATGFFTLGSTENDVLLAQGTPTRVEPGKWHYGFSEIQFKGGRVQGYQNYYGNLRVLLLPASSSSPAAEKGYFTIGASIDDVLAVQGTPTSIQGNLWRYESSSILFREGKVLYAIDADANLRFMPAEDPQ